MKQKIVKLLVLVVLMMVSTIMVSAQTTGALKTDKVVFLNGDIKEGKVNSINSESIQFSHPGETLQYEFKHLQVERIEYASGRIEMLNERKPAPALANAMTKNKVGVLPITYIGYADEGRSEEMSYRLQDIAIAYLSNSASQLTIQDPVETNALLLKAGITEGNIRQYTPAELAGLLHVEYLIMGSVLQNKGNVRTVTNRDERNKRIVDDHHKAVVIKERNNNSRVSTTIQDMQTEVSLSVYKIGVKIYSKSRQSILSDQDAYKATLHYMLKRTPLYRK